MYSTAAYLYDQKHDVLLLDTSGSYFTARWRPVYSKKLVLNKGVDNNILFTFLNQDQKPVNITGKTFTFRAISQDGAEELFAKDLTLVSASKGQSKLLVTSQELDSIEAQPANYSLEYLDAATGQYRPVFVDDNAGARSMLAIVDSVYPQFTASTVVTVPDQAGHDVEYTSTIFDNQGPTVTYQIITNAFTGNVQIQGASDTDNAWYNIGNVIAFTASTATSYANVSGFHPLMRLKITTTSGTITDIKYR
jgi:hypothetical protein